jgi:hypothetical protein
VPDGAMGVVLKEKEPSMDLKKYARRYLYLTF